MEFAAGVSSLAPSNGPTCGVSASSLNNYLGTKNSPRVGQGANLMSSGAHYNIDPRLFVSLAGAETGFGNNITAGQFNAFNVLYNGHNSPFASFQSAINSVGHNLTNPRNGYDFSAEGVGIKQGQAEITVVEAPESSKQTLAQVIAYYTQDTTVLSHKDVPGEPGVPSGNGR